MRVEEYRYTPDGEPKVTLHFSTPDETVTMTFRVKIEYELSVDNEDWHEDAKMVQSYLQEFADEWISNVGKQIVDHATTLEGNADVDLLIEAHRIINRMLTAEQFLRDADPEAYKTAVKRNVREGQEWLKRYSGEGDGE